MKHRLLIAIAAAIVVFAAAVVVFGQTTTTTTVTKTVQNPDGTYTVIEYPAKKEVTLNLNPVTITGAKGVATVIRDDDGTRIKLNLTNVPADVSSLNLYAVDESGAVTSLGPIAITNGVGTLATQTALTKFMLIASPEASLTAYNPSTAVVFRSAVPEGYTVIPMTTASGEKVAAVSAPAVVSTPSTGSTPVTVSGAGVTTTQVTATTTSYSSVAMLNIPHYKKGDDTKIKVDFSGAMTGSRANVFITPRKDGPTEVRVRFHELKDSPADQKFILWAVSPDHQFQKLGQVVNTGNRNEAEIKSETSFSDFGLVVTMENAEVTSPAGPIVGTIHIVP